LFPSWSGYGLISTHVYTFKASVFQSYTVFFSTPYLSRSTSRPNQLRVQCIPGLFPGGKAAGTWHWSPSHIYHQLLCKQVPPTGPSWPVIGRTLLFFPFLFLWFYFVILVPIMLKWHSPSDLQNVLQIYPVHHNLHTWLHFPAGNHHFTKLW